MTGPRAHATTLKPFASSAACVAAKVRYWLMKSEAEAYSIHDLERDGATSWDGVRNYEARNFMDAMKAGDLALFYHSNADPPGVAGVMRVVEESHPDPTAWDLEDSHFDARSTPEKPLWRMVKVQHQETLRRVVALPEIKHDPKLQGMTLVSGNRMRLSIHAVDKKHFERILALGRKG